MTRSKTLANDSGMTLVETLVVMCVMVLITMLAFPRLERMLGLFELREAAGSLETNLRFARSDALRSGDVITFQLGSDGKSYTWSEGEVRRVPDEVSLRMLKGQAIAFYGDGTSTGGAIAAASGNEQISIIVDPATGAVAMAKQ